MSDRQHTLAAMMEEPTDGAAYIRGQLDLKMVTGRYSSLLVGQLKRCFEDGLANIFPILDEIGGLEGARLTRPTRTKEPTQFKRAILDGLWHKHYAQARFIPQNVQNHWRSNNFENRIAAIIGDPTIRDDLKIAAITQAFVQDGYAERAAAQRLTGEWIVYASQQGVNHYLTLGNHNEPDQAIRDRVLACCSEFPHLDICR